MPIKAFSVTLDSVGTTELVLDSNRVNAVSVTKLSPAAEFVLDIGNRQRTSKITARGVLRFPRMIANPDTAEGLRIVNETAQPGLVVELTVSYDRASDPPSHGIVYESAS